MAVSDALKIARLNKKTAEMALVRDVLLALINNPLVGFVGGSAAMLSLQERYGAQDGIGQFFQQSGGLALVAGISTAQAISSALPSLAQMSQENVKALLPSLPALLTKGVG